MAAMPTDTAAEARQVHLDVIRATDPAKRVAAAFEMSEMLDAITADGIRARHPDYDESMVEWALRRARLDDDELYVAAWPAAPLLDL